MSDEKSKPEQTSSEEQNCCDKVYLSKGLELCKILEVTGLSLRENMETEVAIFFYLDIRGGGHE